MPKFTTASTPDEYSPTAEELSSEMDALEARLDDAGRRIAEALAPEPVNVADYAAHWHDLLAQYTTVYRRIAAMKDGGA